MASVFLRNNTATAAADKKFSSERIVTWKARVMILPVHRRDLLNGYENKRERASFNVKSE
jgi:hypothetical protein